MEKTMNGTEIGNFAVYKNGIDGENLVEVGLTESRARARAERLSESDRDIPGLISAGSYLAAPYRGKVYVLNEFGQVTRDMEDFYNNMLCWEQIARAAVMLRIDPSDLRRESDGIYYGEGEVFARAIQV